MNFDCALFVSDKSLVMWGRGGGMNAPAFLKKSLSSVSFDFCDPKT